MIHLFFRGEVQNTLIEEGCIEWLDYILKNPSKIPPYSFEVSCALLLNLSLKTKGRSRGAIVANSLLPCLANLIGKHRYDVR